MTEEAERYFNKAEKSLDVAKELLDLGYFEDASSKAYYVMFYAAQALLLQHGIQVTKHPAVVAKFGEHFAKTKKIDPEYHRHMIDAKKRREIADYDVFLQVDDKEAQEMITWAEEFLSEIQKLLIIN